ncbi:MAG: exopolysaccharide biosynthesis protein [Alphaproteobacteria bacterium]|nr:exopolysaccharide biosynthesis protein [Alphaproteobacteria bacterium]
MAASLRPQTSSILQELIADGARPSIAIGDLAQHLRARAYGVVFLLLAIVSLIPAISLLGGALIAVFAVQMALGIRSPKLPRRLAALEVPTSRLRWSINRLLPVLTRLERHVRPRWPWLTVPPAINLIGLLMAIVSLTFALPVPFTQLPPACAILLIAVSMLERDGLVLLLGVAASGGALAIGYYAIMATGRAIGLW